MSDLKNLEKKIMKKQTKKDLTHSLWSMMTLGIQSFGSAMGKMFGGWKSAWTWDDASSDDTDETQKSKKKSFSKKQISHALEEYEEKQRLSRQN